MNLQTDILEPEEGERKKTKAEMTAQERREEKKRKLKEAFNAQYDLKDDSEFYDTWKAETEQQAKVCTNLHIVSLVIGIYFNMKVL